MGRFLGGDLPELNIEGLEQPEAFEVIARYVKQQLPRVPEENPRYPSRSTADPIPVFLEKLATVLRPKLQEAGSLNPGSEVELEQLSKIVAGFLPPSQGMNFSGENRVRYFVNERLLDQFNQHPNAQPTFLAIAETLANNGSPRSWKLFDQSNYESTNTAKEIAENNPSFARINLSKGLKDITFIVVSPSARTDV